jgi:hypothetical protein
MYGGIGSSECCLFLIAFGDDCGFGGSFFGLALNPNGPSLFSGTLGGVVCLLSDIRLVDECICSVLVWSQEVPAGKQDSSSVEDLFNAAEASAFCRARSFARLILAFSWKYPIILLYNSFQGTYLFIQHLC